MSVHTYTEEVCEHKGKGNDSVAAGEGRGGRRRGAETAAGSDAGREEQGPDGI